MIYKKIFGKPVNGWVILVHGLGEHSGRYQKLISLLNNEGFAVYTFDWPGHGKSTGKRGHTTIQQGVNIIHDLINEIGEKPILFGHSMGGLTVIRYAELHPHTIKGVVASSPALATSTDISSFQITLGIFLGSIFPSLTMSNKINPNDISRNKKAVKAYTADPLVHDRISGALVKSIFQHIKKALNDARNITVPLLILAGTDDVIVPITGARTFIKTVDIPEKELKEFNGAYHEIFEDPTWAESFHATIVNWIKNH